MLTTGLPANLRLLRDENQFRLVATRAGRYRFKLDLVAKIIRHPSVSRYATIRALVWTISSAARAASLPFSMKWER